MCAMPAKKTAKKSTARKIAPIPTVPLTDWRTTDEDEILRRIQRGREEQFLIANLFPKYPVFSNFSVQSASGLRYQVEIRKLKERQFACTCPDFRSNGLGTCKHVEATLIWLKRRVKGQYTLAEKGGSDRLDLVVAETGLRLETHGRSVPKKLTEVFAQDGKLLIDQPPQEVVALVQRQIPNVRTSQEIEPWLLGMKHAEERVLLRREYEVGVASGQHPEHVTLCPLYPYQREGMLHLAFKERALLADEMGLGKTIQAIAACALVHHLGGAKRVLVVTPASLKTEWEEQIGKFTTLDQMLVFGGRTGRLAAYRDPSPPFFTIVNYEQVVTDALDINEHLKPDIIVLDEAQRIKNWATKTAQSVKRLQSRYAFVLTGTPIENRIDEIYSIVDFLDKSILGPLFRFNREFYELDDRGRASDYRNLAKLHQRISPIMLRRRKAQVETELPDRTDRNLFIKLTPAMQADYDSYKQEVTKLLSVSMRRALTKQEQDRLMIFLSIMRMICDSPSIVKMLTCEDCPKLAEIAILLDTCLEDPDVKVIIFSEWVGMLEKVRVLAEKRGIGYAWHTGSVPQKRRRGEIMAFRNDPKCRLFISSDSGGVGLNLQNASVVINCDLPWNPAKLEQRIARAWRKHQRRPVTVVNLIAEGTIEHLMLTTLAMKTSLSEGVLDGTEESLKNARLKKGADSHLAKLRQALLETPVTAPKQAPKVPPDPAVHFAQLAKQRLGSQLIDCHETYLPENPNAVLVAIVSGNTSLHQAALEQLSRQHKWQGSTPILQVCDEHTWATIQALQAAGFLSINTRASRPLTGVDHPPPRQLTAEQLEAITTLKSQVGKKLKVSAFLLSEDLAEDTIPHLKNAIRLLAQSYAIEQFLLAPPESVEIFSAHYQHLWRQHAAIMEQFFTNSAVISPAAAQAALQEIFSMQS